MFILYMYLIDKLIEMPQLPTVPDQLPPHRGVCFVEFVEWFALGVVTTVISIIPDVAQPSRLLKTRLLPHRHLPSFFNAILGCV